MLSPFAQPAPVRRLLALALAAFALVPAARGRGEDVPARAGDTTIAWAELDALLLDRYARSEIGRSTLLHLLKSEVLEMLGRDAGIVVSDETVDARVAEIEREVKASKRAANIDEYLEKERVEPEVFRRYLRLGIVQEILARRALGIRDKDPITGEQQETWLEGKLSELGVEDYPPPWKDGYVVRCGPVKVALPDFVHHLRRKLEPKDVREACYQLLLVKRLRARMPDLSEGALDKACQEEVARRGGDVQRDPKYKGVTYQQLLESQGIRFETWSRDPAVRIGVLARLWVERSYSADELKRVYADEREHYDGLYGEAIETWAIFLNAGRFENQLQKRTYEEADGELSRLKNSIQGAEPFRKTAAQVSEDAGTRDKEGHVGWVTRAGEERHLALKNAIFGALDAGAFDPNGPEDARERMLGPLHTSTGSVLFWLGARRPTPGWETMVGNVVAELRRRFVDETLAPKDVVTFLERE